MANNPITTDVRDMSLQKLEEYLSQSDLTGLTYAQLLQMLARDLPSQLQADSFVGSTPGDSIWHMATVVSPWTAYSGDPPRYRKDSNGWVHWNGRLVPGTSSTQALSLPVGYRPAPNTGSVNNQLYMLGEYGIAPVAPAPSPYLALMATAPTNQGFLLVYSGSPTQIWLNNLCYLAEG